MLRQAALVLVAAAALAPVAAAGTHAPQTPPKRVVVRTELVRARDGFDWLDAAAGFGLAIALVAVALLVAGHRLVRN